MVAAPPPPARVDPVTQCLGNFGKWQLKAMLIIFLCKIPTSWFMAIVIFSAAAPNPGDFWCTPPEILPAEYETEWIAKAHNIQKDSQNKVKIDYCRVYTEYWEDPLKYFGPNSTSFDPTGTPTRKCNNYSFNKNYHSLVVDFGLVCGRDLLVPLSQCLHVFGLLIGGILAYFILKHVSPRNVMMIGISAQIIFGNMLGVIRVYEAHVMFRWLTAASCALMYTSGSMIFVDITDGAAKKITSLVFELFWSIGLIMMPLFKIFIEDWWKLYYAISMPTILLIFLIKDLPESPRWLLRQGRIEEARQVLIEGAKKNKRRVPINLEEQLKTEFNSGAVNPPQASWCTLWDGQPSKIYILAVHFAWSMYILNFNCVVLNIRAYGRDHFSVNTVAVGLSEIVGVFIGMYIVLYTSRRWLWAGVAGIGAGFLGFLAWYIPQGELKETHVVALEMAPTLAIKTATSIGMCVLTVCTVDLVCADRKKILMFSSTVWARAWFVWAPFIYVLRVYVVVLPLIVFASLSVIGGILMVIVHQNQYRIYLKDCEERAQVMRAVRSISSAGLDWIRRKSSVFDVEEVRKKSIYEAEENRRKSLYAQDQSSQLL